MPPAAEVIGVPARAAKSSPAWKACEWANGSMRLPNDDVSSAPGIGSRVGRRIKASDCSAAAFATDAICCSTRPSWRRSRRAATTRSARAAAARRRRRRLPCDLPRRPDGGRRHVGVQHADPLAELRRLAFEPEQARRDRADLLERERKRERLRRRATPKHRRGRWHRRASSRARRPNPAGPTRRPLPGRSAAGPTRSSPATGCSRRWQSSRTPCPLLQTDAASASAPRRSQGQSAPSTKSILGVRGPPESTRRCNGLFSAETLAQVHARPRRDVASRCRSQANGGLATPGGTLKEGPS